MLDDHAASQARHDSFVERVRFSREVWGLKSDDGWAVAPSNEVDASVMVFWSDAAYARRCAQEEWAHYEATPIPLDQFVQAWLPGMLEEGFLVGTNWSGHMIGLEVPPVTLRDELLAG